MIEQLTDEQIKFAATAISEVLVLFYGAGIPPLPALGILTYSAGVRASERARLGGTPLHQVIPALIESLAAGAAVPAKMVPAGRPANDGAAS